MKTTYRPTYGNTDLLEIREVPIPSASHLFFDSSLAFPNLAFRQQELTFRAK
jgi:hypothetical protein